MAREAAATNIEKIIGADAGLSKLDERYSAIYSEVRTVAKRKGDWICDRRLVKVA